MKYVDITDGTILTFEDLRSLHPNVSFPLSGPTSDWLSDNDIDVLVEVDIPAINFDQKVVTTDAVEDAGEWKENHTVVDLTTEEIDEKIEHFLNEVAAHRYDIEVGGITSGSHEISTDRDSRSSFLRERIKADADSNHTVLWKMKGGFVTLTAAEIISIDNDISTHLDKCFEAEKQVADQIQTYNDLSDAIADFQSIFALL